MEVRAAKIEVLLPDNEDITGKISNLKLVGDNILICSHTEDSIFMYVKKDNTYECLFKLPKEFRIRDGTFRLQSPGGFFQMKRNYYIIDNQSKMLYRVLPRSEAVSPFFSLCSLKNNSSSAILSSGSSRITDLVYHKDQLWFTVRAGYSSSISMYNFKANSISFNSFSKGPFPNGIAIDPSGKHYWILDSYNRQLYKLSTEGKFVLSSPIKGYEGYQLTGLLMDKDGSFKTVGVKYP